MRPRAATCPTAPDPASLSRWALAPPRVLQLRTLPSCRGGLRRRHMSYSSEPRSPAEVGSSAATCSEAPDFASQLRWALALSHVLRLQTLLPSWDGLWRRCVSYGFGPRFPVEKGSGASTRPAVSNGPWAS
jgi:hypothetical protein